LILGPDSCTWVLCRCVIHCHSNERSCSDVF
jgi:hypothetical protein